MGYAVQNFSQLGDLIEQVGLNGRRVMDLGSQDVTIFNEPDYRNLADFVRRFGGDAARVRGLIGPNFPAVITARDVFAAAGFEYICCDVDQRPGTVYIDFNDLAFDRALYNKFDLVMNAGTTEHLSNPVAAFFLMHQLCRRGGLLFNEVPFSGWTNHGLNNLTAKFWHSLRWMNSYRVLSATIKYIPEAHPDDGNFGGEHLAFIQDLDEAAKVSSSIEIIFQKTLDRGFIPPYDAVCPTDDDGTAVEALVRGSLRPFVAGGALTEAEAAKTTNRFLIDVGLRRGTGLGRFLPKRMRNSRAVAFLRYSVLHRRRHTRAANY